MTETIVPALGAAGDESAPGYDEINLLYRQLKAHAQRLTTLNELSRVVNSTLDLDAVLDLIMTKTLEIMDAEAGSLILVEGPQRELVFRVTRGAHAEQVAGRRLPWGTGLTGQVAASGIALISNDVRTDPRWHGEVDDAGFMRAMLILPLVHRSLVIGVLTLINKRDGSAFATPDVELCMAFADHAALAIENARLHLAALEKERLEHELLLAFQVQSRLIPRQTPDLPGWEFAAWWQPAREVSGDYYDFFPAGDQLGLAIADVSDKGLPAALLMAVTRSILRAGVWGAPGPAQALIQANRLICQDTTGGMFVTLFYAQFDPAAGALTYVNAGHNPPLLCRAADGTIEELERTGIVLGFDPQWRYGQRTVALDPGDALIFFTDGVTEAIDAAGADYGDARLQALLAARHAAPAAGLLAALRADLQAFTGDRPQRDDITIVVVRRTPA